MIRKPRRTPWHALLLALVAGGAVAPAALADDPKPADAAPAQEDPPLAGEEKKAYDAAMAGFEKRYKAIKNRDEMIQFLNELDAESSRAARDWLVKYARVVKSADYRVRAFEALARKGGSTALGFLCGKDGVRSSDALVQKQAVEALAKSGDRRCVGPLLDVLSDPALKMETVASACLALAKIDPSDEKVKEALRKASGDRRDTVRAAAFEAMGYGADDKAFALLLDTLRNAKNASARAGAAAGLGHAGRKEAIPALKAAVADEKVQPVREAAIKSLKDLGATTD